MVRKTPDEKLAELMERKGQLEAQIQKHQARLRTEERKRDTRRKIIAGALALEHASIDPAFRDALHGLIQKHVTRPDDQQLFTHLSSPASPVNSTPAPSSPSP